MHIQIHLSEPVAIDLTERCRSVDAGGAEIVLGGFTHSQLLTAVTNAPKLNGIGATELGEAAAAAAKLTGISGSAGGWGRGSERAPRSIWRSACAA